MAETSFLQILLVLVAGIALIIILTTKYRVHAFFALLLACFVVGLGVQMPVTNIITTVKEGFGNIMLSLGLIIVLGTTLGGLAGSIKFIFQPAEEGPPGDEEGGAQLMVKEGVMDNPKVDAIFGLHIGSNIEIGKIEYKSGSFMASSDWFTIKVKDIRSTWLNSMAKY